MKEFSSRSTTISTIMHASFIVMLWGVGPDSIRITTYPTIIHPHPNCHPVHTKTSLYHAQVRLLPVLEEVEGLYPLGQQVEALLLWVWLVEGSQLRVPLLEGLLDGPVFLFRGGVLLNVHAGEEVGEVGGDEVVEVVGGIL